MSKPVFGRRALAVAFASVAIMASAPVSAAWINLPWIEQEIEVAPPPIPEAPTTPAAAPENSIVGLTVRIPIPAIEARLETEAPTSLSGRQPVNIGRPVVRDSLDWRFERGPIALRAEAGRLAATTHIQGDATVSGRVDLLLTEFDFSQSADLAGDADMTARPQLKPDWFFQPNLTAKARVTKAEAEIARVKTVSFRSVLQPRLDAKLAEAREQLERDLERNPVLKTAATKIWDSLHRVVELQAPQPAFLTVSPTAVRASQPEIGPDGVKIALSIEARTAAVLAGAAPAAPEPGPLPDLELGGAPEIGRIKVVLPAYAEWDSLNALIAAKLAEGAFPVGKGDTKASAEIEAVRLSPGPERRIVAAVDVRAVRRRWFLPFPVRGTLYVTARPRLSEDRATLALEDVRLTPETSQTLSRVAVWLAGDRIARAIESRAQVGLEPAYRLGQTEAQAAADKLADRLNPAGVELNLKAGAPRLLDLTALSGGLWMAATIEAEAEATILTLDNF